MAIGVATHSPRPVIQSRPIPASEPQSKRTRRELTSTERRVHNWIAQNHGVLTRVANELNISVQFCQRIAYSREARSKGMRVERRLKELGCPLAIPVK